MTVKKKKLRKEKERNKLFLFSHRHLIISMMANYLLFVIQQRSVIELTKIKLGTHAKKLSLIYFIIVHLDYISTAKY